MPYSGYRNPLVALACLAPILTACSSDEGKAPPPLATTTAATPAATPDPAYTVEQVKSSLYERSDLGKNWTTESPPDAFKQGAVRGCSDTKIELVGSPKTWSQKFGAPRFRFEGINYAQFVAVHSTAEQAVSSMQKIRDSLSKCPDRRKVPQKKLSADRISHQHDDTWELTEGEIDGWQHLRGFEKSVYPPSLSRINVFYLSIDYAQRGNLVFSSIYWQRVKPKDSGKPIAEKATDVLTEQLKRFN